MPSGTAPRKVLLTPLLDRGGSDSDSSATDGRAMTWAPTSKAALVPQRNSGPGFGFFFFFFFSCFKKTGKHIVAKQ